MKYLIIGIVLVVLVAAGIQWMSTRNSNPGNTTASLTDTQTNANAAPTPEPTALPTPPPLPTPDPAELKKFLQTKITKQGSGEGAKAGDTVTVHYTGTLTDGSKFDSSRDRNQPFVYKLGSNQVIRGWEYGLLGMKKGEVRRLTIAPEYGYGERGSVDGTIKPNTTLIFDIEMIDLAH